MQANKPEIKAAVIDLYDGYPNQAMRNFQDLLEQHKAKYEVNLTYQVFNLRGENEVPGLDFDVYISSGGPGSPIDSENSEWECKYWNLIDAIDKYNQSGALQKKHVLFVCHSFQLMCRRLKLGDVNMRDNESYGIYPVNLTQAGLTEVLFKGLTNPFPIVDSREWQVINPDENRFKETGAQLVAIEQKRLHNHLPRAMMAIRFNDYFFGTQFHPEVDPDAMKIQFNNDEKKQSIISEYGQDQYNEIMNSLSKPEKLRITYQTIIPRFLYQALQSL